MIMPLELVRLGFANIAPFVAVALLSLLLGQAPW
jgi:hypothetical protein